MTSAFEALRARVRKLEETPAAGPNAYTAISHNRDRRGRESQVALARFTATVRFPGVTARSPVTTYTGHAWSTSYATGGESIAPTLQSRVPGFLSAIPSSVNGYTFSYDSGTNKLKAFTGAATEVAGGTNLQTAVGTTPILVVGRGETLLSGYTAGGRERLVGLTMFCSSSVTRNGSAYWTFEARVWKQGQTYGTGFGQIVTTDLRGITGNEGVPILGEPDVVDLETGDRVVLSASSSSDGSPAVGDVTLVMTFQREVR